MIEPATPADVADIAALEALALASDAWSESLVEQGVTGSLPTVHYLVSRLDGRLAGYAVASVAGDVVELQRIAVDPGRRRAGVATALLDAVVELARAHAAERVLLEVREDNAGALAFYADRGFTELARRPRYYRDGTTAVVLVLSATGPDVKVWATS